MKLDQHSATASDGSIKYRFQTSDDLFVEALSFTYHDGLKILCLSTQVGCDMGCKFCGTGLQKRIRNLTQEEIVQQATLIVAHLGWKHPDTITLAGMGEPLANYKASMEALETFRRLYGDIRLSLSTVGLTQKIRRMTEEKRSFGLYLSLHGADDVTRRRIMPSAEGHPIVSLIAAAEAYAKINAPGLVRISYLLLQGINDTEEQLSKLIDLIQGKGFSVQLRLWNSVDGIDLERVPMSAAEEWEGKLKQAGIQACIRPSAGQEISGGCGQMAAAHPVHTITPIKSIRQAVPLLQNLDDTTLVLFDIDGVVSIPSDPCLHPSIFKKHESIVKVATERLTREQRHILNHLVVGRPSKLIETEVVEVVRDLQRRGVKVFGFTASCPGVIHTKLPPFHQVREKHLKDLGLDFSVNNAEAVDFVELNPTKGAHPGIRNGIIHCCGLHNTKGSVLKSFLSGFPRTTKVIFFEDKMKHLESVATTLAEDFPSIRFMGFHYQGLEQLQYPDPGADKVQHLVCSLVNMVEAPHD